MKRSLFSSLCLLLLGTGLAMADGAASAADTSVAVEPALREQAQQAVKSVQITPDLQARVQQILEHVNSPVWQQEQQALIHDIKVRQGLLTANPGEIDSSPLPTSPGEGRMVVFISTSMPMLTLRRYAHDLEKIHGVMVLRGMLGGLHLAQPTLHKVSDILRRDEDCAQSQCAVRNVDVIVDPVLFRRYDIQTVPAAVFIPKFNLASYCQRGADQPQPAADSIVYGDASIRGMLLALQKLNPNPDLQPLINAFAR